MLNKAVSRIGTFTKQATRRINAGNEGKLIAPESIELSLGQSEKDRKDFSNSYAEKLDKAKSLMKNIRSFVDKASGRAIDSSRSLYDGYGIQKEEGKSDFRLYVSNQQSLSVLYGKQALVNLLKAKPAAFLTCMKDMFQNDGAKAMMTVI